MTKTEKYGEEIKRLKRFFTACKPNPSKPKPNKSKPRKPKPSKSKLKAMPRNIQNFKAKPVPCKRSISQQIYYTQE